MSREHMIDLDLVEAEAGLDALIGYLKDFGAEVIEPVAREVLPKLGAEVARTGRGLGPRSAKHRGPGRRHSQKWRSEITHAVDTIRPSRVYREEETGRLVVDVGPRKGDNAPTFYLKFHEFGWLENAPRPFMGPARRVVMDRMAENMVRAAINKRLARGIPNG